ncbi:hypothetical protein [Enterovibrio norvegicus]|uniref:DoxX family protein n=1 Tax=Enterovibrio norvegicus TaxID=188144 RepID=A0A2N7L6L7_9GAMM|nr:hypothetical protein [Enterovibrio norvegicus]PML76632.1 hypothetical protein BCT69_22655 [Enterovibrio norvegicus]PMN89572.1 hypothetical protein BCT23_22780 [Enterovibrio norvegicus]
MKYLKWGLCIFIAFVFVQSLFFKFTGSPETTFIFGTLGEWSGLAWFGQYGAYMVGIAELIASILLFTRLHALGALMAVGTMTGAIFFHLFTPIGVAQPAFNEVGEVVGNDGGILFVMACLVWLSAAFLLYQSRNGDQEQVD